MTYLYTHYHLPTNKRIPDVSYFDRHQTLNIILKIKNLTLDMVHVYNPSTWEID